MADLHLHLDGPKADRPDWGPDLWADDDTFDAAALERAIAEERARAYASLAELDAA